jgi:hypothetical protein
MKINVLHILSSHYRTLSNDKGAASFVDVFIFYILPLLLAGVTAYLCLVFSAETYSVAISVFSIFSALLLSVQIALFSILHTTWVMNEDIHIQDNQKILLKNRATLLNELNLNISYMIVISVLGVMSFFVFFAFQLKPAIEAFISTFFISHFFLSLLMIVKRAHAVFQREYDEVSES